MVPTAKPIVSSTISNSPSTLPQSSSLLPQNPSNCHSQVPCPLLVGSLGLEEPFVPIICVLLIAPTPPWPFPSQNRSLSKRDKIGMAHGLWREEEERKCSYPNLQKCQRVTH